LTTGPVNSYERPGDAPASSCEGVLACVEALKLVQISAEASTTAAASATASLTFRLRAGSIPAAV
jgi:hypothetical protein